MTSYPMPEQRFRSGGMYTIKELGELARRSIQTQGLTHQQVADWLNVHVETPRGEVTRALRDPERNPTLVLLIVNHFTEYDVEPTPKYEIRRK